MIVLSLTSCSNALKGDLTRWLFEVDTNIYVGKQSTRVRDKIWERVTENTKSGRAVMVFPANNEQGFDFRIYGATWKPVDFDGLKLMLRPHPDKLISNGKKSEPYITRVEKQLAAKRFANTKRRRAMLPGSYITLDIVTESDSTGNDEIISISILKFIDGNINELILVIRLNEEINNHVLNPNEILTETAILNKKNLIETMNDYREFCSELPIVLINSIKTMIYIRKAFDICGYPMPSNSIIDIMGLVEKYLEKYQEYDFNELINHFDINVDGGNPNFTKCYMIQMLYEKIRLLTSDNT